MIQMFHVSKSYEGSTPALSDVTLKIGKGEFLFITGPSGAGKSTLLKLMCGSEAPTQGQIILDGRNYVRIPQAELPSLRRRIGFVFQDFKLLPNKTVFDNVALALKVMGVAPADVRRRVARMLTYVKLQHRANFKPLQLSGGEQQRVAIARALVKDPAIILADEPTGNLDPELSVQIIELFKEVNSRGTTVVVATHDKGLIERYARRTVALESGRLV
ncbi:MAG TPA: cell division ATP-binding protein FtsE [Deltaproteobacteria bacterium]|nr:MAG: cell division ATP-binding protein FtsE [Deltaproteobacteria bacterium GWA2_55_82]OGQ62435.1 MAG: cell division ATP-binding protein FtsE [Deltaproteobacteria bacterium RIFCSPLOWO2_02_FULL_55_12]OIJ73349.1 MAG: cell division ATP-binding protein FtsE [Deltaproteobacteria bacterium GWC2_55_46]HBG45375.1 cell division ATP-binding protein FtsE [Deltaproteobacteria bacterium]HCY10206.1 cell division ATP-binding protein FtsE [Deltaproteobacteria bacterium]